jgi:hypothetical protein
MNIEDAASNFFLAKEKFNQASIKMLESSSDDWQDYLKIRDEFAKAKEILALAKGEEYVINYNIECIPDLSDSKETILQFGQRTFLTFKALSPIISETGNYKELGTAIISFEDCILSQFGYPSEEHLSKHPLFSKGLDECLGVGQVVNSLWQVAVIEKYGDISLLHSTTSIKQMDYKHFIFSLKDNVFECIAKSLSVTFSENTYIDIVNKLASQYA